MNERLAVEAHVAALLADGGETVLVLDVVIDAVEDDEPVGARGEKREAERGEHGRAVRRMRGAQLLRDVVGAHDPDAHAAARLARLGGDRLDVEERERRLDHAPELDAAERAGIRQRILGALDIGGGVDFRDENGVRPGGDGGPDVAHAPGRIERVHTDRDFALAITAELDRATNLGAGLFLGVGRDRVFEIEDQRIGRDFLRFFKRAAIRAGHVENAAARAGGGIGHGKSLRSRGREGAKRTLNRIAGRWNCYVSRNHAMRRMAGFSTRE